MTQEYKELLLKDLSARLPYGVFCSMGLNYPLPIQRLFVDKLDGILLDFYEDGKDYQVYLDDVKPYLRPISSMTEEEKDEYSSFVLREHDGYLNDDTPDYTGKHYVYTDNVNIFTDWLNAHHFDYRGLIEKGLAIEAPEGMYKEE